MKRGKTMNTWVWTAGALALLLAGGPMTAGSRAQTGTSKADSASTKATGNDPNAQKIDAIPIDRLVTATCRQAWHLGGENEDAFFDIVERLTELAAHNRGVTLPDDRTAGSRAGQWIRTQALKDPDQLLYAVVDHAVLYSVSKGTSTPVSGRARSTQSASAPSNP